MTTNNNPTNDNPNTTLTLSCFCQTFKTTLHLPPSASLPLKSAICHCTTCRRISGHMFATFAVIPLPLSPSTMPTKGLTCYRTANSTAATRRWFCTTCGASIFNECLMFDQEGNEVLEEWDIATGIVRGVFRNNDSSGSIIGEETGEEKREVSVTGLFDRVQMWVSSTLDGGAALWINSGKLMGMDRRSHGRSSEVVDDSRIEKYRNDSIETKKRGVPTTTTTTTTNTTQTPTTSGDDDPSSTLKATCECGDVNLFIYPPDDENRYEAGLDACESCRLVSGFEITAWVTVPLHKVWIVDRDDTNRRERYSLDSQILRTVCGVYKTSERMTRMFCRRCGATVFAYGDGKDSIDVGAGLLDPDVGARAEGWFDWVKYGGRRVAWVEDAIDEEFVDGLVRGADLRTL